jgi:phosphopantothenoylcysteine decarboxylase/phosphopantothenate--cysteine ligase
MRILITAGPTREPIDPVRFIGNRSSGKLGAALFEAACRGKHDVTLIVGPVGLVRPSVRRIDVETAGQMFDAVLREFVAHDLLIMAAAPADFRPIQISPAKLGRSGRLVIECEPTQDIVAAASRQKRPDQRTVAFSLESAPDLARVRQKMLDKRVDLMVYNPVETMDSPTIQAVLLWPNGSEEPLGCRSKVEFADILLQRALALFV